MFFVRQKAYKDSLLSREQNKLADQDVSLKKTTSNAVSFKNDGTLHGDLMGSREKEIKIMTLKLNEMSSERKQIVLKQVEKVGISQNQPRLIIVFYL